jgi:hypothetical protein
MITRVIPDMRK